MNLKFICKIIAGAYMLMCLFACIAPIQEGVDKNEILGIYDKDGNESTEIKLYPLGDEVSFSAYPLNKITQSRYIEGVDITQKGNLVTITAAENITQGDKTVSLGIWYNPQRSKNITVLQEAVKFNMSQGEKTYEKGESVPFLGDVLNIDIDANVGYSIWSENKSAFTLTEDATKPDRYKIKVSDGLDRNLNGEDIKGKIAVNLIDKNREQILKQEYFFVTLIFNAFRFCWEKDGDVGQQSVSCLFNDLTPKQFKFKSSGKWTIDSDSDWLKIEFKKASEETLSQDDGFYGEESLADPIEYSIVLTPLEINKEPQERKAKIRIKSKDYADKGGELAIEFTQKQVPVFKLAESVFMYVGDSEILKLSPPDDPDFNAEYSVNWKIVNDNIATLSDESNTQVCVTADAEGKTVIRATIKIGEYEKVLECNLIVVKEYEGSNPGEDIGKDDGEW